MCEAELIEKLNRDHSSTSKNDAASNSNKTFNVARRIESINSEYGVLADKR